MSDQQIRVLVADDHAVVREGIRQVLAATPGLDVVAEASNGEEALELAQAHKPDVIVLDISMPGVSGLEVAARIRQTIPETAVLILSMHDHTEYVLQAVRAGAHGYVLKDASPAELREAVRAVHAGQSYFGPRVADRLSAGLRGELEQEERRSRLEGLTAREREVLALVATGQTNKEIGQSLGISHRTVETHRESIVRKLRIRTVAELTRFAIATGLVAK